MSKKLMRNLSIIAISIALILFFWHEHSKRNSLPNVASTPVMLAAAESKTIYHEISATGNLNAINNAIISAKVNGYVQSINYQEGQNMKNGDVIIQLDDRHERAALALAEATAALSQEELHRDKKLLSRGLITHDDYLRAEQNNQQNQASLLAAKINVTDKSITAPFDGVVGDCVLSVGDYVTVGMKITTVTDLNPLSVGYSVSANYLAELKIGQPITVDSTAYPGQKFSGKITYIGSTIDPTTQTITVHASLENTNNALKPGEIIHISQSIGKPTPSILVPTESVIATLNGYYVYTVENNHAKKIQVKIGTQLPSQTEILSGLTAGEKVVTAGVDKLQANQPVKIVQ